MMSRVEESPHGLLAKLVQTALNQSVGGQHSIHFGESAEDVARLRRRLHLRLFDTLLGSLPGPLQHGTAKRLQTRTSQIGSKERLLMIIFKLREKRRFDDAQQLESALERLAQIKGELVPFPSDDK